MEIKLVSAKDSSEIAYKQIVTEKYIHTETYALYNISKLNTIMKNIQKQSAKGKTYFQYCARMTPELAKMLLDQGYEIKTLQFGIYLTWLDVPFKATLENLTEYRYKNYRSVISWDNK